MNRVGTQKDVRRLGLVVDIDARLTNHSPPWGACSSATHRTAIGISCAPAFGHSQTRAVFGRERERERERERASIGVASSRGRAACCWLPPSALSVHRTASCAVRWRVVRCGAKYVSDDALPTVCGHSEAGASFEVSVDDVCAARAAARRVASACDSLVGFDQPILWTDGGLSAASPRSSPGEVTMRNGVPRPIVGAWVDSAGSVPDTSMLGRCL